MTNKFLGDIITYSDVLSSNSKLHAWKIDEMFHKDISILQLENQYDLIAVEQTFIGIGAERNRFDELFSFYNLFVERFISNINEDVFLLHVDAKPQLKNRIRSYKGLLSKEFSKQDYIEIESKVNESETCIGAIVKVNNQNINFCLNIFSDSKTACFFATNKSSVFSNHFLETLIKNYVSHNRINVINYFKLASYFCKQNGIVCRIGGDGGDLEVSFQVFCDKTLQSSVSNIMRQVAKGTK